MRDRTSNASRMAELIGRWRGSGQTLSAFARAQGETRDRTRGDHRRRRRKTDTVAAIGVARQDFTVQWWCPSNVRRDISQCSSTE